MILNLTKSYIGVQFRTDTGELIPKVGMKSIIGSSNVNHELQAMLYTCNYDDTKVTLDQLAVLDLSNQELEVLASIGAMQLDLNEADIHEDKFEYRSLLDTHSIISIKVPMNVTEVKFIESESDLYTDDGWVYIGDSNSEKLIITLDSASEITSVSEELHNLMSNPHSNTKELVTTYSDIINKRYYDLDIVDGLNLQSNTRLFDSEEALVGKGNLDTDDPLSVGDSEYIKVLSQPIYDANNNIVDESYIVVINFESKKLT